MMYPKLITFVIFLFFTKCSGKSYRDHSLIHVYPTNEPELDFFKEFEQLYNVTFWTKPSIINKSIEFSISRLDLAGLVRDTKDMNIEFHTVIRDLQSAFENQTIKPYIRRRMETFGWENYYSVEDIYSWLRDVSEVNPKEVQLHSVGKSVQDRHILARQVRTADNTAKYFCWNGSKHEYIDITEDVYNMSKEIKLILKYIHAAEAFSFELRYNLLRKELTTANSKVIVEGGCHAREWISPSFVTYMINTILTAKNSTNEELKKIAYLHEWIFIPLLNPDGYSHSQTTDRLWRKNYHGTYGVDLNRNFGIQFGKFGASEDIKSSEYCGAAAFSEPETMALASFVRENSVNLQYYIAFHSYGQYIIIPYAFEKEHLDNFDEVKNLADQIAKRSAQKFGVYFDTGTAFDTVGYFASGTSADWVKKSIDVPYVITIELPDQGYYGFALPQHLIQSTCEATMDSLLPFLVPQKVDAAKLRERNTETLTNNAIDRNKGYEDLLYCYALCLSLVGSNINY